MEFTNLWLVRAIPEKNNRIDEFLEKNIVAIGWAKLGNMTHKDKNDISKILSLNSYKNSNVTVGVLNHFFNNMKKNDLCIIPDGDNIYLARVKSDYYFVPAEVNDEYPHQRKVEFLNKDNPINRNELPKNIQKSLGAQNTIANLNHRIPEMKAFLQDKLLNNNVNINSELMKLLPKALANITEAINSNDIQIKTKAAFEVIKLVQIRS